MIGYLHLVLGTFLKIKALIFLDEHDLGKFLLSFLYALLHFFLHYVALASSLSSQISHRVTAGEGS